MSKRNVQIQGETDWKVMAIDVTDPLAENLNDIQDVDKVMPGFLKVCVVIKTKYVGRLLNSVNSGNS